MNKLMAAISILILTLLIVGTASAISPDIKANGSGGPLSITSSDNLSVSVELDSEGSSVNADWWVAYETRGNWYTYIYPTGWGSGISSGYQGALFDLSSISVFSDTLSAGTYNFYFGVDTKMNGSVDMDHMYYDSVTVNIDAIQISEYFPLGQGDTWTYREEDLELTIRIISGTENIGGVEAIKVIDEDEDYNLFTISNGIIMYKIYDADDISGCGWSMRIFNPPVTIVPAEITIGSTYTFNTTINYIECTGISESASGSVETTIEGFEDVTIPAGTFKDSLKLKMVMTWSFPNNQVHVNENLIWLVKGLGEVKSITTQSVNGNITDIFTDDLVRATVGSVNYP